MTNILFSFVNIYIWLIGSSIVRFPDPHYVVVEPDQLKHSSVILSFIFFLIGRGSNGQGGQGTGMASKPLGNKIRAKSAVRLR